MGVFLPPQVETIIPSILLYGRSKSHCKNLLYFSLGLLWLFSPLLSSFLNPFVYYWGLYYTLLNKQPVPVPREPQFSPSMGHFGTCCVWSSGNKVQSQGSILTRAVGRNLITPHDTGGVFFPFQLLPTSWGTDRWAGMLHCLPICLRVFPSHLSQSQLFGRRG